MRVIPVGVLALFLVVTPLGAICDEGKDEIEFNQDPIVTVDIDPSVAANSTSSYFRYAYTAVGLASIYALASWKLSFLRNFNSNVWQRFQLHFLKPKSSL